MARVLSALLLIPIVLGIVWFLPPIATLGLAALAAVLSVIEYAALAASLSILVPRPLTAIAAVAACVAVGYGIVPLELVLLGAVLSVGSRAVVTGQPGPG